LHHCPSISLSAAISSATYNGLSQPTLITYANGMRSCLSYDDPRSWLSNVAHHDGTNCAAPWAERWYNRDALSHGAMISIHQLR
jgi:hypothetical protein